MRLHIHEDLSKSDLDNIFKKVYNKFVEHSDVLEFPTESVSDVPQLFKRKSAKSLGRCIRMGGSYTIELNPIMLQFNDDGINVIEDVVAHELLHTLPGCYNHGTEFHKKAQLIKRLMGYEIDTLADENASEYFTKYLLATKPNYKIVCDKCGREIPFERLNNYIKYPKDYMDKCGGTFTSYKLNNVTGDYEEYKNPKGFIG